MRLARRPDVARSFLDRRDRNRPQVDADRHRLIEQLPGLEDVADSAADCLLPLDVVETTDAVDIVMDLPGVPLEDVSVITFLGERLAEEHPIVKSWTVGSPADVPFDSMPQASG